MVSRKSCCTESLSIIVTTLYVGGTCVLIPVQPVSLQTFTSIGVMMPLQAHCTAPYKAPELFDVPSQCTIDERVDVWSLGCLL